MSFKKRAALQPMRKSANHVRVRDLLASAYPGFRRLEEEAVVAMVDGALTKLFVDFVLPDLRVAIEVHGRQHVEYVAHFHGSPEGFAAQQRRDRGKAEAIVLAGYALVVIHESELAGLTRGQLIKRVRSATQEIKT